MFGKQKVVLMGMFIIRSGLYSFQSANDGILKLAITIAII
jgi:hypothetical protein